MGQVLKVRSEKNIEQSNANVSLCSDWAEKKQFLLEIIYKDSPNANPMEMIKDTMIALFGLYKSSWVEFK